MLRFASIAPWLSAERFATAQMLNLPYTFRSFGNFAEMRLGVIQGLCDVAITASEIDPNYALCAGPPRVERALTYDYGYGDYASSEAPFGSSDYSAPNAIACLEYGLPYITSGFALLSLITTKPFDSARTLTRPLRHASLRCDACAQLR